MRILSITTRVPWPLSDGARIVMHQAVRALTRLGHDVDVFAIESEDPPHDLGDLPEFANVSVFHRPVGSRAIDAARTLFQNRPTTQLRKESPEIRPLLDALVMKAKAESQEYGLVISDQSHIAPYGRYVSKTHRLPYLFRSHNVEHEIWGRHLQRRSRSPMSSWFRSQYHKWRAFEIEEMCQSDLCAAITTRDAGSIASLCPDLAVETIPAGVDLGRYPFVDGADRDPGRVLIVGGMDWAPNKDAALWFVDEILPIVRQTLPDLRTTIIGKNPPPELLRQREGVDVVGFVDDIVAEYAAATLGIVPLRVGGGMRVKIVEMMGAGLPVVASPIAIEGNLAVAGDHYAPAASAAEFAASIVSLVEDSSGRNEMAVSARRFVEETYADVAIAEAWRQAIDRTIEGWQQRSGV